MGAWLRKPTTGPEWVAWVTETVNRLDRRRPAEPPVGAMVVFAGGGTPPARWLAANGTVFDTTLYPLLAAQLGGGTLPNPPAVSGEGWIIRAT